MTEDDGIGNTRLIGTIPLNRREEIRVELFDYYGRPTVSIRRWFTTPDDRNVPTPKGIEFSAKHLPELDVLVGKASKRSLSKTKGE